MTDPRTMRELALMRRVILLEVELVQQKTRASELEQAISYMWYAEVPLDGIADGARQSWPHPNPDGSDTTGGSK